WTCPTPTSLRPQVVLGHGGGGRLTAELISSVFLPALNNPLLAQQADSTVVLVGDQQLAFTTDS
ncbi:MAG TPA: hydrogenase expression/formation protein HypE, partial [Acidimicrobiaceae bacterium]|nr:hydrogenase expression/formation protein HypE [Acidimicrobiaceae bacterium]